MSRIVRQVLGPIVYNGLKDMEDLPDRPGRGAHAPRDMEERGR